MKREVNLQRWNPEGVALLALTLLWFPHLGLLGALSTPVWLFTVHIVVMFAWFVSYEARAGRQRRRWREIDKLGTEE